MGKRKSKKLWQINNNDWFLTDVSGGVVQLENTAYTLEMSMMGPYLSSLGKKFEFDFKLYGLRSELIDRVLKYYQNSNGNLGVLLNGVKGTGKTVTAKILANKLNLPIIIVDKKVPGLVSFLSRIDSDVVVVIDEYEKIFSDNQTFYNNETGDDEKKEDSTLLSIMDGIHSNKFRRTWILTTNDKWLNENMLNRPGRIRYKDTFDSLELDTIDEIVEDLLVNKEFKDDIVNYIKQLELITVDILKSVITEVNIFNEPPATCCKYMNLDFLDKTYTAYDVTTDEEVEIEDEIKISTFVEFEEGANRNRKDARIVLNGAWYILGGKYQPGAPYPMIRQDGSKTPDVRKIVFRLREPMHRVFSNRELSYIM